MKKEEAVEKKKKVEDVKEATLSDSLSTQKTPVENQKKHQSTSSASTSTRFGIVTLVLALMGIVISVDSLVKVKEWDTGLKTFKGQIEKHFEEQKQRLNSLENSLQNLDARQQVFDKQLGEYHTTLSAIAPLLQKDHPVDVMWQLQKAYSWLQEAELDLSWSDNWQDTVLLLQAADDAIVQLKIAALQPVHELLAKDIEALSAIQPIDETALLQKIKDISEAIVSLPAPTLSASATEPVVTKPAESSGWKRVLNSGFEWIQKVVVIKPAESAQKAPQVQSRSILNENLVIALQQTQWALLKKDNVLFHWSIEQVLQIIQNNGLLIDLNAPKTIELLQNLHTLSQQNLAPALPNIQPVSQQLKTYMDTLTVSARQAT